MPRGLLITNPVAARHDPGVVRTVSAVLASAGSEVHFAGTTRHGDAARLAAEGVDERVDVIAVHGGDGTTMQAAGGMVGSGIPLAIIPGGTGNLLAGNLRLPRDPAGAARLIVGGVARPIDLGRMDRAEGIRHFAVACGAGIDAQIMEGASAQEKRRWGMAAYLLSTWRSIDGLSAVPYRVKVDGQSLDVEAITVLVANCGEVGPLFFSLGSQIALDDGWLDVVVLRGEGVLGSLATMWQLFRGHGNGNGRVVRARGRTITVESTAVRPVQMDGEAAGVTPFTVSVMSQAIRVLVPKA